MRHRQAILYWAIFSLVLMAGMARGQEEITPPEAPPAPEDISPISPVPFQEIRLSSEGVVGVDSVGREWEYDFSRERFISGQVGPTPGDSKITIDLQSDIDLEEKVREAQEREWLDQEQLAEELTNIRKLRGLQLGSVVIEEGEIISGPVVAVGPITVKGTVNGDVISYKRITVTSGGVINGDARAPEIVKMRDGIISGSRTETPIPEIPEFTIFEESSYTALTATLIILAALVFSSLLAMAIVPRNIKMVAECFEFGFAKSFFLGLGTLFAFAPLMALLALTIIGIPLALIVLPLGLILAAIMGTIAAGFYLTGKLEANLGFLRQSNVLRAAAGVAILFSVWVIMGIFMISTSDYAEGFAVLFMVLAIILWSVVVCTGIGAVIITRFGTRDCRTRSKEKYGIAITVGSVTPPSVCPPPPPTPPPLKKDESLENKNGSSEGYS